MLPPARFGRRWAHELSTAEPELPAERDDARRRGPPVPLERRGRSDASLRRRRLRPRSRRPTAAAAGARACRPRRRAGSNCVPAASASRRNASSTGSASRYGRSVVIAWNASQAKMMRASSGISSPREPVGVAAAVVALVAGAHDRPHLARAARSARGSARRAPDGARSARAPRPSAARASSGSKRGSRSCRCRGRARRARRRFSWSPSSPSSRPTSIAMSQIQRACDDVYESFASSALASASTVERNVRSSVAKLPAFVIASRAWLAIPPSSSSSRAPMLASTATASAASPWSSWMNATRVRDRRRLRVAPRRADVLAPRRASSRTARRAPARASTTSARHRRGRPATRTSGRRHGARQTSPPSGRRQPDRAAAATP